MEFLDHGKQKKILNDFMRRTTQYMKDNEFKFIECIM